MKEGRNSHQVDAVGSKNQESINAGVKKNNREGFDFIFSENILAQTSLTKTKLWE